MPSAEDKIIHGLQVVAGTIRGTPPPTSVSQLEAITALQEIFESWRALAPPSLWLNHYPAPASPRVNARDSPRVVAPSPPSTSPTLSPSKAWRPPLQAAATSLTPAPSAPTFHVTPRHLVFGDDHSPRVVSKPQQPLLPPACSSSSSSTGAYSPPHQIRCASPTCSPCFRGAVSCMRPIPHPYSQILLLSSHSNGVAGLCAMQETTNLAALCSALLHEDNPLALSVLDPTTGNMLEHCQLRRDPWYKTTWDTLYANELSRLCQGIGSGEAPSFKHVAGTNMFFCIDYHNIPSHKRKKYAIPWLYVKFILTRMTRTTTDHHWWQPHLLPWQCGY